MVLSKTNYQNQINFYRKYYFELEKIIITRNSKKKYLGNKKPRKCRFCGQKEGETTFNTLAHAIPEFIGNKTLFSYHECDKCNGIFGRNIEDHFAKYLGLPRTLLQISGKKNPSFKDKNLRIDCKSGEIDLTLTPNEQDNRIVEIQEDIKQISLETKSQPYIRVAVYKCLAKMAVSIMPESELLHFGESIPWISQEMHSLANLQCYMAFTDEVKPFDGRIQTLLLKRKNDKEPVPYMIYVIAFSTYFFQIVVPCPKLDSNYRDKPISLEWFPLSPYTSYPYGQYQYKLLNLSSPERVKDGFTIQTKYEKSLET